MSAGDHMSTTKEPRNASSSPTTFFCRALYDYEAPEGSSCLSFLWNDVIEVFTQEPSGWWDGCLARPAGDKRGWFPSNYVTVVSDEEAELSFSDPDAAVPGDPTNTDSAVLPRSEAKNEEGDPTGTSKPSALPSPLQPGLLSSRLHALAEILFDPRGSVRAGTVPALVEYLTAHKQEADQTFFNSFLMTFKSFMTLDDLFNLLVQRFWIQPPSEMAQSEREDWLKRKHDIQSRVLDTFKSMVADDDVLEQDETFIFGWMKEFLTNEEVANFPTAKQLLTLIELVQNGSDNAIEVVPPLLVAESGNQLKPWDIEPLELARQLTITESQLYRGIRPMECLQQAHGSTTDNLSSIAIFIQHTNKIALWVAESILSKEDPWQRARAVEHIVSTADWCRSLNNFSTMTAITSGLNSSLVRRLKRTWEHVDHKHMAMFKTCEETISSDRQFLKYRSLITSVIPPCIPYFGFSYSVLRYVQGLPDLVPAEDGARSILVNFAKRRQAWEVMNDMKRWRVPYNLDAIPSIQARIEEILNSTSSTMDSLYEKSLELEPRAPEDEKMAQLLRESGFS
ncbi:ras guanine nucleotide exchange factor domain-containing protein [Mycena albidolilacea]|uniref:Ras guanine nucleotide exchange factor domain-containing protein n=1 Tax=Mycena albidolilacea TaxID=1033008 RepID=A0AAD7ART2_9AGAR|nr:ras guanine nucleotide exchange factor domain-containing protein [Mycena albidolilacea]